MRLIALPLVLIAAAPVRSQDVASTATPGPPANDPVDALGRYLRVLATFPNNLDALTGAGRSALAIGDTNAAISFFSRAEKIAPGDGRIKAGLASALVQMEQPQKALDLFAQASSLGVPEADIASDRGLARDLVGDSRRAQQDYMLALRGRSDDETVRRLAVSQAISGDRTAAFATLDPLLRKQDRAAWRVRAFVQALTGDRAGAEQTALALMPRPQAQAMTPFFARLASLRPGEKAAAVNLGQLPSSGRTAGSNALFAQADVAVQPQPQPAYQPTRRADTPLIPAGAPLGSPETVSRAPRRRPGAEDEASLALARAAAANAGAAEPYGTAPGTRFGTQGFATTRTQTITLTRNAVTPSASPAPRTALPTSPTAPTQPSAVAAANRPAALAVATTPPRALAPAAAMPPAAVAAPMPLAEAPAAAARTEVAPTTAAGATSPERPGSLAPAPSPALPAVTGATVATTAPLQTPAAVSTAPPPSGASALSPAGAAGATASAVPMATTPGAGAVASASPTGAAATSTIQAVDLPASRAEAPPAAAPAQAPVRAAAAEPARVADAAPLRRAAPAEQKLARADEKPMAGKASPTKGKAPAADEEERVARAGGKGTKSAADKDAKAKKVAASDEEDVKGRGKSGKGAKEEEKGRTKSAATDKESAKGKKLAAADKDEDKAGKGKGKAAAKDEAAAGAADRYWVQVASGANKSDLGKAWNQTKAKAPKLLGGRTTWTSPWKQSNRLLVGPFKNDAEAQEFVNQLGKAGMGGMQITTHRNTKVERLAIQ